MKSDDYSISTKGMYRDIVSMRGSLSCFLNKGKEYEDLVKFIQEKRYDENEGPPLIKDLVKESGVSNSKVTRYLKMIYKDVMEYEDFIIDFHEVKYRIWAKSNYFGSVIFDMKYLPVVPRVGEKVELLYFSEKLGTSSFYVKKVQHKFHNGCQLIEIELAEGDYNLFWHFRLDEAVEKKEIHWTEVFDKKPYQLKEKLGITPKSQKDC